MQISVDIWALRDKMLRDDPNLNTPFVEQTSRQCKSTSLPKILATILLWGGDGEVTFDHVPGKEKNQVSPMFISEHQR